MKKLFSFLLVLSVMVLLPMGVKAYKLDVNNACEESCTDQETGKCIKTCKIKISNNTGSISEVNVDFNFTNGVKVKSVTAADGWILNSASDSPKVQLMAETAVTSSSFTAATVVFDLEEAKKANADCSITMKIGEETVTIPDKPTETPKTGASLPVAIIATGICAAGVIYFTTKKSKKLHKI